MSKNLLTGATKCLLLRPEFLEDTFYNLTDVFRTLGGASPAPPLGALVAAAYLPKHWEIRFIDADVTPLTDADYAWADIVMISGIGPQYETILKAAANAKRHGKPTVVGGAGPTLQPDKYIGKVDFVIQGEAEVTIPRLLEDLGKGKTGGFYKAEGYADVSNAPIPRYDLCKIDQYLMIGMSYTRGCPFVCEFCALWNVFGKTSRVKSPEQVVAELQYLYDLGYRGIIDFGYDNLIGNVPHTEKVLEAMAEWAEKRNHPFAYTTEATMNIAKLPRILKLMERNDFRYVFLGIESADPDVLDKANKGQNTQASPDDVIKMLNSHGIVVNTGLILGFDGESSRSAQSMFDLVQRTGAFPTLILPLHALPGTPLESRMREENRLFEGGIDIERDDRTDTATTGLNFVTSRPRTEIWRDLEWVLTEVYDPKNHFERMKVTTKQLRRKSKFVPPLKMVFKLVKSFAKIATTIGMDKETGPMFWKALLSTLVTNPVAAEVVIGQAVFNWNYRKQAATYVKAVMEEVAEVEKIGEPAYNASRKRPLRLVASPPEKMASQL